MVAREAQFYILVGTNGTGKSTVLRKFLAANKRNLIIPANHYDPAWSKDDKIVPTSRFITDPNDFKQLRKIRDWNIPRLQTFAGNKVLETSVLMEDKDSQNCFAKVCDPKTGFKNGGLFIDDYKNWIYSKGTLPRIVRQTFGDRRHRMIDIFMATHSFQDVNADLLQFNPRIVVFRTTLPPNETVAKKMQNFSKLQEIIERVNRIAETKNKHYCEVFIPSELT